MRKLKTWKPLIIVALLCIVVAASAYTVHGLADANRLISSVEDESLKEDISLWQVKKDLQAIDKTAAIVTNLEIVGINEEGRVVYMEDMPEYGVTDYYDTWKEGSSTFVRIREGDLENILEFAWNGKIYNDGIEIGG